MTPSRKLALEFLEWLGSSNPHAVDKLAEMVEGALEGEGWQPIETAPKDGQTIVCFWPALDADLDVGLIGQPIVGAARWMKPASQFTEHWCYEGKWTPYDPTLWRPLYTPPNPKETP